MIVKTILKHGYLKPRKFTCGICGCEFIAEATDYTAITSNNKILWYTTTCPDCYSDTVNSEPWEGNNDV